MLLKVNLMNISIIAPSIISADFARLGEEIDAVLTAGADWIHVDIMDNHFVPNLTMGPQVVTSIRNYGINVPLDVHLMLKPVDSMLAPFAQAGADYISFHVEAVDDVLATIALIRAHHCKVGVVYNPRTPVSSLEQFIEQVDMVLIMSVDAGFAGQAFITETMKKVRAVRQLIDLSNKAIRLEVDGGINAETIKLAAQAGADTFVTGSTIFNSDNYQQTIQTLRNNAVRASLFLGNKNTH